MTQQLLWDEAVDRLKSRVSPQNFDMWLRPIELTSWDGATLRLRAPNSYVRIWFESNFLATLVKELTELGQCEIRVEFEPDGEDRPITADALGSSPAIATPRDVEIVSTPPAVPAAAVVTSMTSDEPGIRVPDNATLNPRYSFDTFVAGPSNQLAFAASQAAASSYPPKYNPVFI